MGRLLQQFRLLQFWEQDFQADAHFTALFRNLPINLNLSLSGFVWVSLFKHTDTNTNMILPEEQQLFCLKIV